MNRIKKTFDNLRAQNKTALVGYMTAGYPDMDNSVEIIKQMCRSGVDVIELGIPFSDPTSDGPVIQKASQVALAGGIDMEGVFSIVRNVREEFDTPIILFSYYNPIFVYGLDKFSRSAQLAGADGTLIVDLSPEEASEAGDLFNEEFPLIKLIAPTTDYKRVKFVTSNAYGFVYLISKTGVTGSGEIDFDYVKSRVDEVRSVTKVPACVGFGVTTDHQAREIARIADGVIVGSAFVKCISEASLAGTTEIVKRIQEKVRYFKDAMI